mgnify:CR=1 FL=1
MNKKYIWHIVVGSIFIVGSILGDYMLQDGNSRGTVMFVGVALMTWGVTRSLVSRPG